MPLWLTKKQTIWCKLVLNTDLCSFWTIITYVVRRIKYFTLVTVSDFLLEMWSSDLWVMEMFPFLSLLLLLSTYVISRCTELWDTTNCDNIFVLLFCLRKRRTFKRTHDASGQWLHSMLYVPAVMMAANKSWTNEHSTIHVAISSIHQWSEGSILYQEPCF